MPMYVIDSLEEIKVGEILIADGGFTCLQEGEELKVKVDKAGDKFVECEQGQHFLDGQENEKGKITGFIKRQCNHIHPSAPCRGLGMMNKRQAIKDLDVLNGYGPGGSLNPAAHDGYFSNSLTRKYGISIEELEKQVKYWSRGMRRKRAQKAYRSIMGGEL